MYCFFFLCSPLRPPPTVGPPHPHGNVCPVCATGCVLRIAMQSRHVQPPATTCNHLAAGQPLPHGAVRAQGGRAQHGLLRRRHEVSGWVRAQHTPVPRRTPLSPRGESCLLSSPCPALRPDLEPSDACNPLTQTPALGRHFSYRTPGATTATCCTPAAFSNPNTRKPLIPVLTSRFPGTSPTWTPGATTATCCTPAACRTPPPSSTSWRAGRWCCSSRTNSERGTMTVTRIHVAQCFGVVGLSWHEWHVAGRHMCGLWGDAVKAGAGGDPCPGRVRGPTRWAHSEQSGLPRRAAMSVTRDTHAYR